MNTAGRHPGSVIEVFLAFLKLGLTSFGGPVAHLGYFRTEIVERRQWLDDSSYADLVALCQFLPGPASSQVGIALGQRRAGWAGALAAWVGFTLPSAVALILFAFGVQQWAGLAQSGAVHGLKVVAVAVVAQAVWGMARSLCPDRLRAGVAVLAALLVLALPSAGGQILAIVFGAVIGRWALQLAHLPAARHHDHGISKTTGAVLLLLFVALLLGLPLLAAIAPSPLATVVSSFYRAGALVFGGGHVVLPLLQLAVVPNEVVSPTLFLAGYGATQAVPGPLFTFAAYLGAVMSAPPGGWFGGLLLLAVIFVPAFLLVLGALPFWELLRQRDGVQRALAGINAAVVGILGAALYDPVWTSAIHARSDFALALAAFGLLVYGRQSPVVVVLLAALAGWLLAA
ncbi:chromate efflux transporter [Rhodoferax sp.]|uniref:chromate efflux transporter n=1 Tax=Rhodoferax sp. TaxID=50421 RepID=UPI0027311D74|nr:chromate efflux transporter [Rhodoferax sp.]MDP1529841.1 chromate efflux transporter [Rhodoferax sp.]MDP1944533.1 chromate efflux transporter [Rhodoferax sp.]MDP2440682.1 chromate efflux transporter [Rhodoferax sp.]MDZ4208891.1 chromate efflux transporter [Rhodoferax sp.]